MQELARRSLQTYPGSERGAAARCVPSPPPVADFQPSHIPRRHAKIDASSSRLSRHNADAGLRLVATSIGGPAMFLCSPVHPTRYPFHRRSSCSCMLSLRCFAFARGVRRVQCISLHTPSRTRFIPRPAVSFLSMSSTDFASPSAHHEAVSSDGERTGAVTLPKKLIVCCDGEPD